MWPWPWQWLKWFTFVHNVNNEFFLYPQICFVFMLALWFLVLCVCCTSVLFLFSLRIKLKRAYHLHFQVHYLLLCYKLPSDDGMVGLSWLSKLNHNGRVLAGRSKIERCQGREQSKWNTSSVINSTATRHWSACITNWDRSLVRLVQTQGGQASHIVHS